MSYTMKNGLGKFLAIAALVALPVVAVSARNASAQQVEVSSNYGAPPPIPEYDQPPAPGDGYLVEAGGRDSVRGHRVSAVDGRAVHVLHAARSGRMGP